MKITIKACITNAGLSQAKVAELMGIAPSTVGAWCTGKRKPRIDELERFCRIVSTPDNEVTVSDIFFN